MTRMVDAADRTVQPMTGRTDPTLSRARPMTGIEPPAAALILVVVGLALLGVATGAPITILVTLTALLPPAIIDLGERRLPNAQLLGALIVGTVAASAERTLGSRLDDIAAADIGLGLATMAGTLLAVHLAVPSAMGFGDVKLAGILGPALGLLDPLAGLVALATAGAVGGGIGLVSGRRTIPFGPALLVGAAGSTLLTPLVVAT